MYNVRNGRNMCQCYLNADLLNGKTRIYKRIQHWCFEDRQEQSRSFIWYEDLPQRSQIKNEICSFEQMDNAVQIFGICTCLHLLQVVILSGYYLNSDRIILVSKLSCYVNNISRWLYFNIVGCMDDAR